MTGAWHRFLEAARRAIYSEVLGAFRTAAEKLKAGCRDVVFPDGCFPPSLPFCRSG